MPQLLEEESYVADAEELAEEETSGVERIVEHCQRIVAGYAVGANLTKLGIQDRLEQYEAKLHAGMDVQAMAKLIWEFTEGHPFLVQRICELLEREVTERMGSASRAWTDEGVDEALQLLLAGDHEFFRAILRIFDSYPGMKGHFKKWLMEGLPQEWYERRESIVQYKACGLIKNVDNTARITNRIFETLLYNHFIEENEKTENFFSDRADASKCIYNMLGEFNVRLFMDDFVETYAAVYGPLTNVFPDKDGRELFLQYLKPVISGKGYYYVDPETRDRRNMDIVIKYLGRRYVIKVRIWRINRFSDEGIQIVDDYFKRYGLTRGYLFSFNFNVVKATGTRVTLEGKRMLYEGTV